MTAPFFCVGAEAQFRLKNLGSHFEAAACADRPASLELFGAACEAGCRSLGARAFLRDASRLPLTRERIRNHGIIVGGCDLGLLKV
jgi:hypothetical protein